MSATDWFGAIGVGILLVAFLLSLLKKISLEGPVYSGLNILGAGLACYASLLLDYWPFIILESIWTLVSVIAFIQSLRKNNS